MIGFSIPDEALYYTAIILIGLSTYLLTSSYFKDDSEFRAQEKLDKDSDKGNLQSYGFILKFSRPFFRRYFVPVVESMKSRKKIKEKYKRKIASAGMGEIIGPEDLYAFKLFLIIGFPLVFVSIREFLNSDWPLWYVVVSSLVGFFYPDFWLSGLIKKRQEEVTSNMPFAVDLLALSVEAGLDFIGAMVKVVEKARPSAITDEFTTVIKEIKIGASRAEALRNMAWRLQMSQVSSFCATLIAADSVGASIGPILKDLAKEMRQKKSALVEKKGATAPTKMLFPMIGLIVTAVVIILFGPIILSFME